MQSVPIQAIANQQFSVQLSGNVFDFTIRQSNGVMVVSISINNVPVISNYRAAAGMRIIPAQYEEQGNFMFITANYELPDYTKFNMTQILIYLTADELAALRVKPLARITDSFFNPIVGLPLRYKPQGYT